MNCDHHLCETKLEIKEANSKHLYTIFTVEAKPFSFKKWLIYTFVLYTISLFLQLHLKMVCAIHQYI